MVLILLCFLELPNGSLLPVGIPLMLTFLLPSEQARLMLPLIGRTSQNEARLLPDTAPGEVEPGGIKCLSEV